MTSKVSPGQPEGAFLRLLRTVANIAVLFGSAWSVRFTLQAGHRSPSRFLMALFVIWVSCPFLALVFAIFNSQDWSILSRAMVYSVVLILSLGSLAIYGRVALGPPRAKPAFVFLVVPALSWLVLAATVSAATLISRRRSFPRDPG